MRRRRKIAAAPIGARPLLIAIVRHHAVPTLGLLFHELATNAAQYGGLASADGRLNVTIASEGDAVAIGWHEEAADARRVDHAPKSHGFSSRLEQASVTTLRGSIERTWRNRGLEIAIRLPKLAAERAPGRDCSHLVCVVG